MVWLAQLLNESEEVIFSEGDASALLVGELTVTGKTASTIGNPDGDRSFTVPDVPDNCGIFWIMQGVNLGFGAYEHSSWPIDGDTFGYRIDQAAPTAVTVIRYGWRANL